MATYDEAISNECIDDLTMNVIKSVRNMKKRPDCSSIRDYVSKLLSNSDITDEIVSNRLLYLNDNNKIKNKLTYGRDSYYIIDEILVQVEIPPNLSNELIPGPVKYETPLIKDMGKLSFLNPTNKNWDDKNNYHKKIENLIIELTALKLFVQEQFYIIKKQLEETIPESTKQLPFSSLRSEIEYLREENGAKTLIIKQSTENKAMTFSCNVVSTSKDHADKNIKESANSLENNEKSNKNLNQTKKPDEKILADNHNTENKDSNEKNRKTTTEKKNDTENKDTKEDKSFKKKKTEKGGE